MKVVVKGGGDTLVGIVATIAFVALKKEGVIDWSWWWVLSPILVSTVSMLTLAALILAATHLIKAKASALDGEVEDKEEGDE